MDSIGFPWFFVVLSCIIIRLHLLLCHSRRSVCDFPGVGHEKRRSFVRDATNNGRKLATVLHLKRSVQEKGVVEDARGRMWVIDREDSESPPECTE